MGAIAPSKQPKANESAVLMKEGGKAKRFDDGGDVSAEDKPSAPKKVITRDDVPSLKQKADREFEEYWDKVKNPGNYPDTKKTITKADVVRARSSAGGAGSGDAMPLDKMLKMRNPSMKKGGKVVKPKAKKK